ncbi:hypothetical protein TELCIR_01573 [Teladorsagia circumcincta]|uniref:Major facilitator superfamily (MFS) profile domain-containing protein n=1 Tax=Teladorsagia circumcincta TaxID=45464 RepID=A0A2G9V311_TELCI|nr:hypothetical protein TELCIR_01573 [Teladorsagia circumcincta]
MVYLERYLNSEVSLDRRRAKQAHVDPTASETFFGIITSAYSVGQGIASPAFGFWMNRSKSVRQPITCGIIIMILSNVIFCFVEAFKEEKRRWIMMVARKVQS